MKMTKFTTYIVLFILFVFPAIMTSFVKLIPNGPQPGYDGANRVSIYGDKIYEQKFVSDVDNLTAIGASIKNPNLKNKSKVNFQIKDENENILREVVLNGFNIDDGSYIRINFEPIQNSKDRSFKFVISSINANVDEVLELFIIEPNSVITKYIYNNEEKEGGTPIVLYSKSKGVLNNIYTVYSNLLSKLLLLYF
jgi:hypothetical protein